MSNGPLRLLLVGPDPVALLQAANAAADRHSIGFADLRLYAVAPGGSWEYAARSLMGDAL